MKLYLEEYKNNVLIVVWAKIVKGNTQELMQLVGFLSEEIQVSPTAIVSLLLHLESISLESPTGRRYRLRFER
jgi:hypothetical protein